MAGNNQIPNYGSKSLLNSSNYVTGGTLAPGLSIGNIANTDLKWERTTQMNIGFDLKPWITVSVYRVNIMYQRPTICS